MDRNEQDTRQSEMEMATWKRRSPGYRYTMARRIARTAAEDDRANPHAFKVVVSHLLSNIKCPQDYSISVHFEQKTAQALGL